MSGNTPNQVPPLDNYIAQDRVTIRVDATESPVPLEGLPMDIDAISSAANTSNSSSGTTIAHEGQEQHSALQASPVTGIDQDQTPKESPSSLSMTAQLRNRDDFVVEYSRALLSDGDTLVFIDYHGPGELWHVAGFKIPTTPRRVHSSALLATGSMVFRNLLEPNRQARIIRLRGLENKLPPGISYVIDLTPPTEGDEAADLVSQLSCPPGVRSWFLSSTSLSIPKAVEGGEDYLVVNKRRMSSNASLLGKLSKIGRCLFEADLLIDEPKATKEPSKPPLFVDDSVTPGPIPREVLLTWESASNQNPENPAEAMAISQAIENSLQSDKNEGKAKEGGSSEPLDETASSLIPEDYLLSRHIAGIDTLLGLIAGNPVRLDSAPKVWTLTVLADFFDCPNVIVDDVTTWFFTGLNQRFAEILPEATLKLGMHLKSSWITRVAYSILVGEGAMAIAFQRRHPDELGKVKLTAFGRQKGDLDEDMATYIQHASESFHEKMIRKFEFLVDKKMAWLDQLPEFEQLLEFEKCLPTLNIKKDYLLAIQWQFGNFIKKLRAYVRTAILIRAGRSIFDRLARSELTTNIDALRFRRYVDGPLPTLYSSSGPSIYEGMVLYERIFTVSFWKAIEGLSFRSDSELTLSNLIHNGQYGAEISKKYEPAYLTYFDMKHLDEELLRALKKACKDTEIDRSTETANANLLTRLFNPVISGSSPAEASALKPMTLKVGIENDSGERTDWWCKQAESKDSDCIRSRHFYLDKFFFEVIGYLETYSRSIIGTSDLNFERQVSENVFCLTNDEYKFLPLWAGGDDDGSGGVLQQEIPPAFLGPTGPGPAYHTGYSTASQASSEYDLMSESSSVHTSTAVDDGFSEHVDRRIVISDDGMSSVEMVEAYEGAPSEFSVGSSTVNRLGNLSLDSAMSEPDDGVAVNEGEDYDMGESDSDATIKLADSSDDEENWDGFESLH